MSKIVLEDETLRDGLQVEQKIFSTEEKCELFDLLLTAGIRRVQAGSFVHPKYVPQMADTDQLIPLLRERAGDAAGGLLLSGLVLNAKGLERALACGLTHLSMSVSVSEEHSKRNVKRSVDEALSSMTELIGQAKKAGVIVRAGAQCAFGCVYEGAIPKERVLKAFECMVAAGADEINLADTTGMGNPVLVRDLVSDVRTRWPHIVISLHMHDTRDWGWPIWWRDMRPARRFSIRRPEDWAVVRSYAGPQATFLPKTPPTCFTPWAWIPESMSAPYALQSDGWKAGSSGRSQAECRV